MPEWNIKAAVGGMSKGDSFFIPCLSCDKLQRKIRSVATEFGIKVSVRKVTEDYIKGLRTWRTL